MLHPYTLIRHLVERLREVGVERLAVRYGLADDTSHELKVPQVFRVHVRHRVRLEGGPVGRGDEKRVVLVEDVPREDGVPVKEGVLWFRSAGF